MAEFDNILALFTVEQAASLTGLSKNQLHGWNKDGLFTPKILADNPRAAFSKLYTFRDIVGLKVISILKNDYDVSTQELKKTAKKLEHYDEPWAKLKFAVWKGAVTWNNPETGQHESIINGQRIVFDIDLDAIIKSLKQKIDIMAKRDEEDFGKFSSSKSVMGKKFVFKGTRIPVDTVQRYIQWGYSDEQILKEYPTLTLKDIQAARAYKKVA